MEIRKRYTITAAGVALMLAISGCASDDAPADTTTTMTMDADHGDDHGDDHEAEATTTTEATHEEEHGTTTTSEPQWISEMSAEEMEEAKAGACLFTTLWDIASHDATESAVEMMEWLQDSHAEAGADAEESARAMRETAELYSEITECVDTGEGFGPIHDDAAEWLAEMGTAMLEIIGGQA